MYLWLVLMGVHPRIPAFESEQWTWRPQPAGCLRASQWAGCRWAHVNCSPLAGSRNPMCHLPPNCPSRTLILQEKDAGLNRASPSLPHFSPPGSFSLTERLIWDNRRERRQNPQDQGKHRPIQSKRRCCWLLIPKSSQMTLLVNLVMRDTLSSL